MVCAVLAVGEGEVMSLGDAASKLPFPVFACDAEKRPLVRGGFKAATRDPEEIARQFVSADMIGVPTGAMSGLIAIDVDVKGGALGAQWLEEHAEALPQTRTHKTRSGGLHLIFRAPEGVEIRNSASRVAPGVDVRGEGGYVIFPPSPGYSIADPLPPADMPVWLVKACLRPEPERTTYTPPTARAERYAEAALTAECRAVAQAPDGRRNDTLNTAALKLGGLVAGGHLSRSVVEHELTAAARAAGLDGREIAATLRSGLEAGLRSPRQVPEHQHNPDNLRHNTDNRQLPTLATEPTFATPLRLRDLDAIPPRRWLYGRELVRGYVSVLGSPGGTGKTAFVVAVACSLVTGRALLADDPTKPGPFKHVHKPSRVWLYNLEDPADEMLRRIKATLLHYKISVDDVADAMFMDSGRDRPLVIAKRIENALVAMPLVDDLVEEIKRRQIDVFVVDPFVQSHQAEENRNEEMNLVMALWGLVAHRANCSVWLIHHFRKGGQSGDAESFRGAAAIQGAARVMSTLATMSAEEASKLGIDDGERWQYVRRDNAKANMAPRAAEADWMRLVSVALDNGDDEYPEGDLVQAIAYWAPPSPWDGIDWRLIADMLEKLQAGPSEGEQYAEGKQSGDRWAGRVVMQVAGRTEGQAASIIAAWIANGVLVKSEYKSPGRKGAKAAGLVVDAHKVAEMRRAISGGSGDGI